MIIFRQNIYFILINKYNLMNFSTKAKNLVNLKSLNLKMSKIPKFYKFSVDQILNNKDLIINFILQNLSKKISIRSSFSLEDGKNNSMAGEFEGLSNTTNSKKNLIIGIKKLLNQYKKKTRIKKIFLNSEILFQNHLTNSVLSGVVTNYSINDGSDYYVINYDDTSNLTNTVTSGNKSGGRVLNVFKHRISGLRSQKFKKIILGVKEIENKLGKKIKIDIEFALDKKKILNIFQIRPISTSQNWKSFDKKLFSKNLEVNQRYFNKINKKNLKYGNFPLFGLMPDWNPAEMIGYQPNTLSYSIYKELITDSSWNIARKEMGYKSVEEPLMYQFTGKPYIDARLSFYSFIPKKVKKNICKTLVNFWSQTLIDKPFLHDKIEFDISDGSYDAFSKKKINKFYNFLNEKEKKDYLDNLRNFTEEKILNYENTFFGLNKKLLKLEENRILLIKKFKSSKFQITKKELRNLINYIKVNGIIPFSIFARYAFIAKKLLNSLKSEKIISPQSDSKILNSINSITSTYVKLQKKSLINHKNKKNFIKHFYHLRPGTYDVCIKRYSEKLNVNLLPNINDILTLKTIIPKLPKSEITAIERYLKKNKFRFSVEQLLKFCILAIRLRENSKFIFTRSLSDMLEIFKIHTKNFNIKTERLSNFNLGEILRINKRNKKNILNKIKKREQKLRDINQSSKLPFLITSKSDFFIASILLTKPNFITNKIIEAKINVIKNGQKRQSINNSIILIENADPGFDWVFSHNIRGIITKYGGVNSHMSIRCEELNIPAVIGLGNENYDKIRICNRVILNCKNKQVSIQK